MPRLSRLIAAAALIATSTSGISPPACAQQIQLVQSGLAEQEAIQFAAKAEKALAAIKSHFGKQTSLPITVDVRMRWDIPRANVQARRIDIPLSQVRTNQSAIAHEIAHIVVASVCKKDRFLDEGVGVYVQELFGGPDDKSFPTFGIEIHEATRSEAKRFGRFIPFESAEHERLSTPQNQQARRTAYLIEGSFVKYLIETHGLDKFMKMYEAGTYEASYGKSGQELEKEWLAFIRR